LKGASPIDLDIAGLRVLVTAGASGIGLATARAFVREGAKVVSCDVDRAALGAVAGSDPVIRQTSCDVADPAAVARMFETAIGALGGLDVLVNNAGIAGPTAACEEVQLADWQRTLAVNLTGQFLCAQRAIPFLKASRNASIANLSSAAGRFGFPLRTPYAASKWGVIGLTKSLPIELGPWCPRQRHLPGLGRGSRIDAVFAIRAAARGITPKAARDEVLPRPVEAPGAADRRRDRVSPRRSARHLGQALPIDADTQSSTSS
jgi:NAD(P)-dependent dehydrogenase (short-subunit alcohol dehydrogenase family)